MHHLVPTAPLLAEFKLVQLQSLQLAVIEKCKARLRDFAAEKEPEMARLRADYEQMAIGKSQLSTIFSELQEVFLRPSLVNINPLADLENDL